MQVMLMRLMSKGEYVIVPKGTKFMRSGKLGLKVISSQVNSTTLVPSFCAYLGITPLYPTHIA